MKICVCGWYYRESFLGLLGDLAKEFSVTIIANRAGLPLKYLGSVEYHVRENRGLEFGAYDKYIKDHQRIVTAHEAGHPFDQVCLLTGLSHHLVREHLDWYERLTKKEQELTPSN